MIQNNSSIPFTIIDDFLNLNEENKTKLILHLSDDLMILLTNIINESYVDFDDNSFKLNLLSKEIKVLSLSVDTDSQMPTPPQINLEKLLIGKEAEVDEVNKDGDTDTPLHLAVLMNDFERVKLLIGNEAEVDEINKDGDTPLQSAVMCKHFEMAKLLIEKGAKLDKVNKDGNTALHLAAFSGHLEMAKLLIEKGAKINKRDKSGDTPLHLAVELKDFEMAELLIEKGARLDEVNNDRNTPLHLAVNNFKMATLLIKRGAKVDVVNCDGNTPLYYLAARNFEIAKLLIEKTAKIVERTPLSHYTDQEELAKLLIEKGADVHYAKEVLWREWVAAAVSKECVTEIKRKQVTLKGGLCPVKLVSIFEDFASSYQGTVQDWLKSLKPQLQHVERSDSPQEILTKFATNQTLNFFVESASDHAIDVLYIGDYLLISNRGEKAIPAQSDQVQSILVKRLNRRKAVQNQTMSLTIINKLLKKTDLSFFYDELPQLSGAIEDDFICNIFKSYIQKEQKVGNCWWVSPKSMIFAIMAMSKLLSISCERMTDVEIHRQAGEAMAAAKQIYKEFSKFSKIHLFKEYLTEKMQDKDSEGDSFISPDMCFVWEIYVGLILKYPDEKQLKDLFISFRKIFDPQT